MSDPMTNLQIEDVLSSIRRLVAEGDKTRAVEQGAVADKKSVVDKKSGPIAANAPDRLVLTPALRVRNEDLASTHDKSVVIAALDGATQRNSNETTPVRGDAALRAASRTSPEDVTSFAAGAVNIMLLKDAVSVPSGTKRDSAGQPKPDIAKNAQQPASYDEPAFRHFDRDALTRHDIPLRTVAAADDAVDEDTQDYGDDLATDKKPDPQIDAQLNAFLSDDAMLLDAGIDEDTLRELIVEVIRQELQGAMGERITRNLRKLVRREINRVLAAQDLD